MHDLIDLHHYDKQQPNPAVDSHRENIGLPAGHLTLELSQKSEVSAEPTLVETIKDKAAAFIGALRIAQRSDTEIPATAIEDLTGTSINQSAESESSRANKYVHFRFNENTHPALALESWRIHAEGYHAMGFVTADAILPDGTLPEDIDKSRGENTEYLMTINPERANDCATLRKINLAEGGTFEDLPAYQFLKDGLSPEGIALLRGIDHQDNRLKEMAALARTQRAKPLAIYELMRDILHDGIEKDEIWFFSLVSSTYTILTKSFGEKNFQVIGENVGIDDARVSDSISLTPSVVRPDEFLGNILEAYDATDEVAEKTRLLRGFLFLSEGLPASLMTEEVRAARSMFTGEEL